MGRVVRIVGLFWILMVASPVGVLAVQTIPVCDRVLTDYSYHAAIFEIDYGSDGPDLIVIKNGNPNVPEGGQKEDPRGRPEMNIPQETPQLEIITPTPSKRDDKTPPPGIAPHTKITPTKKRDENL